MTVEYDGTEFCGFQWQPAVRTVASVLEDALATLFGPPVKVTGAGRTDSGVHASGQVVSFSSERPFPFERLVQALNATLPADLSVRDAALPPRGFSARFSARERTYVYAVFNDARRSALLGRYACHVPVSLDVAAMQAAGACFLGEHDFRSFGTCETGESFRRDVRRMAIDPRGPLVRIEIAGNGFLRHMVRTIVGTLLECGRGRRDPGEVPDMLQAADRSVGGPTAPAHGLYLAGVRYDGYDSFSEPPLFRTTDLA